MPPTLKIGRKIRRNCLQRCPAGLYNRLSKPGVAGSNPAGRASLRSLLIARELRLAGHPSAPRFEPPLTRRTGRWHRRPMARALRARTALPKVHEAPAQPDDVAPLTRSQVRQLQRQIRDLDDRTRFLLVSVFTSKFVLYYDVSQDTYVMNNASLGTLFKRRAAAEAIRLLVSPNVEVARCRVNQRNGLVKSSLPPLSALLRRRRRALARRNA